jgi:plastocyanin
MGGHVNTDVAVRRVPTWLLVLLVPAVALIAVLVTGFGGGQSGATAGSATAANTVTIKNFAFSPNPITVKTGTTLTVVNDDTITHTLTADNGAFDTGDLAGGRRARLTLDRPGTYTYHCQIHTFMTGTVRVSP